MCAIVSERKLSVTGSVRFAKFTSPFMEQNKMFYAEQAERTCNETRNKRMEQNSREKYPKTAFTESGNAVFSG